MATTTLAQVPPLPTPRRSSVASALSALVVVGLFGCGGGGDPAQATGALRVVDATVEVPPNPAQASVRFVVDNRSGVADELVAVSSPAAGTVDIHRSEVDERGMASMERVDGLVIPARSQVAFEPGGLHVMFRQLDEPLRAGQDLAVELTFAEAGTRTVDVQVVEPGTAPTEATGASGSTKAMEDHDDAG